MVKKQIQDFTGYRQINIYEEESDPSINIGANQDGLYQQHEEMKLSSPSQPQRSMVDEITQSRIIRSNTYAGQALDEGENVSSNQDPSEDVRSYRMMDDI